MNPRKVLLVGGVVLALLASLYGAIGVNANMGWLSSSDPIQDVTKSKALPPLLAPPDSVSYESLYPENVSSHPIALLSQVPPDLNPEAEIYLPEYKTWEDPNQEAYAVLSSLRYSGEGFSVLVTLAEPSPGAYQQLNELGEEKVEISGQGIAWLTREMGGEYPNRVLFLRDGLVVTVAGNISPASLVELAQQVEIVK